MRVAFVAIAEAFGTAIGMAFAFVLLFGLLLLACMVTTAVIVVLYGFRVATYATALGALLAVLSGVLVGTTIGSFEAALIATVVGFLGGVGVGYARWGSGAAVPFVDGTVYNIFLILCAFAGIASGFLVWALLLGFAGFAVFEMFSEHPRGLVTLTLFTLTPVVVGGYVLVRILFDSGIGSRVPA